MLFRRRCNSIFSFTNVVYYSIFGFENCHIHVPTLRRQFWGAAAQQRIYVSRFGVRIVMVCVLFINTVLTPLAAAVQTLVLTPPQNTVQTK